MPFVNPKLSTQQIALILLAALLIFTLVQPARIQAQAQRPVPVVAQVGSGSPLPVYVVNDFPPTLPDGFVSGTSWKFTTWTTPSTLTFTATVQTTEGGWAALTVTTDAGSTSRWYYIPLMPGSWERQP